MPCGALIWRESWADLVFLMKWAQMNRIEAFNFVISFSIGWEPYTLSLWYLSSSFRCINARFSSNWEGNYEIKGFNPLFIYLFWRVCVLASIMNNVEKTLGSLPDQIRDKWPAVSSTDKDRMTRPENWALNSTMKPQRVISVMESQTKLMFTVQF